MRTSAGGWTVEVVDTWDEAGLAIPYSLPSRELFHGPLGAPDSGALTRIELVASVQFKITPESVIGNSSGIIHSSTMLFRVFRTFLVLVTACAVIDLQAVGGADRV